jgi:hypothetical protein
MKYYRVEARYISYYAFTLQADSLNAAKEKAYKEIYDANPDGDIEILSIEEDKFKTMLNY